MSEDSDVPYKPGEGEESESDYSQPKQANDMANGDDPEPVQSSEDEEGSSAGRIYIKSVTIEGFRSYNQKITFSPFSCGLNAIVGLNGSGKSNLYRAIEFVLLDQFGRTNSISARDRDVLLHEGRGMKASEAKVQIVFDNRSRQIPIDKDDVTIERKVTQRKDEFFINNKKSTRIEVSNLLETSGFSPSNSYYIVRQGNVNNLALMTEEDRFDIICDISGTKFYDKQKEESRKMMIETKEKQEKIKESISTLNDKLEVLEAEKEALEKYIQLEKDIKLIETAIKVKKQKELNSEIEEKSTMIQQVQMDCQTIKTNIEELEVENQKNNSQIESMKIKQDSINQSKHNLESEREKELQQNAIQKLKIEDIQNRISLTEKEIEQTNQKIDMINDEIESKRSQISNIREELNELNQQLITFGFSNDELDQKEFELSVQQQLLSQYIEDENSLKINNDEIQKKIDSVTQKYQDINEKLKKNDEIYDSLVSQDINANSTYAQKNDEYEYFIQQQNKIRNCIQEIETLIIKKMPYHVYQSIRYINTYFNENDLHGYYGPLFTLIEAIDPKYNICIEAASKNKLFNVVTDNLKTAQMIISLLNEKKCGRLTFLPLDIIESKQYDEVDISEYPECVKIKDIVQIKSSLDQAISSDMQKVIDFVFGQTILVNDLSVAKNLCVSFPKLNFVTLDGDIINSNGSITGGSNYNFKQSVNDSRSINCKSVQELASIYKQYEDDIQNISQQIIYLEEFKQNYIKSSYQIKEEQQNIKNQSRILSLQINDLEKERRQYLTEFNNNSISIQICKDKQEDIKQKVSHIMEMISTIKDNQESTSKKSKNKRRQHKFSYDELKTIQTTKDKISLLENEIISINNEVQNTLITLREKLVEDIDSIHEQQNSYKEQSIEISHEEKESASRLLHFDKKLSLYIKDLEEVDIQLSNLEDNQSKIKQHIDDYQLEYEEKTNLFNQVQQDYENLQQERIEIERSLGLVQHSNLNGDSSSLTNSERNEFDENTSEKELKSLLKTKIQRLKSFDFINKLSIQQYKQISQELSMFNEKMQLLEENEKAIQEMIETLDSRKENAIKETFEKINTNFSLIFNKLTHTHGKGSLELSIHSVNVNTDQTQIEEEDDSENPSNDNCITTEGRVAINVSFNEGDSEAQLTMNQLSGGQKSVVALAIVFAIQMAQPAPFYLLDEVDAALDPVHRESLSQLIKELSASSQYIFTTFKPELIQQSDSVFILNVENQSTVVHNGTREEAEAIILSNA